MISETKNICNMPTLMEIKVHQSEETGKLYIDFIEWCSDNKIHGFWQDKSISEDQLSAFLSILYN